MSTCESSILYQLLMMIRLTFYYCASTVYLFGKDKAHHLVGEGHLGQANLLISTLIYRLGETIRTSYAEHQPASRLLLLLYPCRKLHGAQFLAMLIKQHESIGRLDEAQYLLTLLVLLLVLRERLSILELRDYSYRKRHIVAYTTNIIVYASLEMLVIRFAYKYQFCLHNATKVRLFPCPNK